MDGAKRVIVIGTGIGGAGVASILANRGHKVTLLEKNAFIGGKCSTFEKDGFVCDTGVHMYSMGGHGPHGDVSRMTGSQSEWIMRNPGTDFVSYYCDRMRWYQAKFGLANPLTGMSMAKYAAQTYLHEKKSKEIGETRKLLEREAYRCAREHGFLETALQLWKAMRIDESVLDALNDVTAQEFFHRISDADAFLQSVNVYSMVLMVVPPHEASAGELLYCMGKMMERGGLGFPRGGAREIPGAWIRTMERNGGALKLNREVSRIVVKRGKATGVECANGETYNADIVISNAGIKRTMELAGEKSFPEEYVDYVKKLKMSYSYITKKYGLSYRAVESKVPCMLYTPFVNADHAFDYIDEGGVPADPLLFIPIPTDWDEHAAPQGKQLVIMGVPGPIEVNKKTIAQSEAILKVGEQKLFAMYPRMEKAIEWELTQHIATTASITGKPTGECIGLAQIVGQTGRHKPSPRTPVQNLWLVGADAGGRGVGTENAAMSAMCVAALLG